MTIFYGGTKERVTQQLTCQHDWYGPCIDSISQHFKCKLCFCIDRDCTEDEYYQAVAYQVMASTITCDESGNSISVPDNLTAIWPKNST